MASIKKIEYRKKSGKVSTYWQVSYYDAGGKRVRKNFAKQSKANSHRITVEGQIQAGTHIPDRDSRTVAQACDAFILDFENSVKSGARERSTWEQYRSHIKLHIKPYPITASLLNGLRSSSVQEYLGKLQAAVGDDMAAKVMTTFRMIMRFAAVRDWISGNPATVVKVRRETRKESQVIIPEKSTVRAIIEAAKAMGDEEHAFTCMAFFCGLRPSEMRGFPRAGAVLKNLIISQRADEWGKIGPPKTKAGRRTIPMPDYTAAAVHKWAAQGKEALLFPSDAGTPQSYQNLFNRFWKPLLKAAGAPEHYTMHEARHFAASLWIEDGYNEKEAQAMLGHSSIKMTMDTYGHLFKTSKRRREIVNTGEQRVLGTKRA